MHVWARAHVHISAASCECQKHYIPLRLELQAVVLWVLNMGAGNQILVLSKTVCVLKYWALSSSPKWPIIHLY